MSLKLHFFPKTRSSDQAIGIFWLIFQSCSSTASPLFPQTWVGAAGGGRVLAGGSGQASAVAQLSFQRSGEAKPAGKVLQHRFQPLTAVPTAVFAFSHADGHQPWLRAGLCSPSQARPCPGSASKELQALVSTWAGSPSQSWSHKLPAGGFCLFAS